jgi:hypothetical protein
VSKQRRTCCCLVACVIMLPVWLAEATDEPTIAAISPSVITRGQAITITGTGFSENAKEMKVTIDGKETNVAKVDPEKNHIVVLVDTSPSKESAGEAEREVRVVVAGKKSQPRTFAQVTSWAVISKPRVIISAALYLGLVALIALSVRGSVFRSVTGQLSLSKIQMGLWTFVFGFAYVLLAAIYMQFLDITEGMFWMMGISSATAVGAKAIVIKNLPPEKPEAGEAVNPSQGDGKAKAQEKPSTLLQDWDKEAGRYSLSLHRCQIAVWTLIVLVIYVLELLDTMRLPNIPNNLLVLMGISGGTYLGFNFPKRKQ